TLDRGESSFPFFRRARHMNSSRRRIAERYRAPIMAGCTDPDAGGCHLHALISGDRVMSLSLYDASVPTLLLTLENLKSILAKAVAHAEARKFDPNVFVSMRLYPDMLPFNRQIQIASDA